MSLRDKVRQIAAAEVKNSVNLVSSITQDKNQQNLIGIVQSIDTSANAVVQFTDGTTTSAKISTSRPVGVGSYVLVVGGSII